MPPPLQEPFPNAKNLLICHLTWQNDLADEIKDQDGEAILDYLDGPI